MIEHSTGNRKGPGLDNQRSGSVPFFIEEIVQIKFFGFIHDRSFGLSRINFQPIFFERIVFGLALNIIVIVSSPESGLMQLSIRSYPM